MPVPAAAPEPTIVLMSTIAGLTFAAIEADVALLEDPPVPGVTCWMGVSGCAVDWATW